MNITEQQFETAKLQALQHFKQNKKVFSPIFWEIRVTPQWFDHIEWKTSTKKRPLQEAYVRYLCFMNFDYIIKNSYLYQEYRQRYNLGEVKKWWKIVKENRLTTYYGFTAIVNNNKQRIRIIVKKVDGWKKFEYVSVIPAWKKWEYGVDLDDMEL